MKNLSLKQINETFSKWDQLSPDAKLQYVKQLREIGTLQTTHVRPTNKKETICPFYKFLLNKTCLLKECYFNINNASNKNCLHHALIKTKNGRLPVMDISKLFGVSITEINKITNRATNKVKSTILKLELKEIESIGFKYLENHCVCCGMSLHDELEMGMEDNLMISNKHAWCSEKCKRDKPLWQFNVENEFEHDYESVLKVAYRVYNDYSEVDGIFNLANGTAKEVLS